MTTLQEYLENKYPTAQAKVGVTKIDLETIDRERERERERANWMGGS